MVVNFGYPSREPCVFCGGYDNNQLEPRFLYTACQKHYNIPPIEVNRVKVNNALYCN